MTDISLVRGITPTAPPMVISSKDVVKTRVDQVCRSGLAAMDIKRLFPVQKICTHLIVSRFHSPAFSPLDCDLCVSAPTGQGKTLAYLLPIIHVLGNRSQNSPSALIVLPTRDLALQVATVAGHFSFERVTCLVGQTSIAEEKQVLNERSPAIIISTIGRLIDHLVLGSLDLSHLEWLVVDEADRMLSKSDLDKWTLILNSVPTSTQRLLFSATMTSNPLKLNKLKLTRPLFITIGQPDTPAVSEEYLVVPNKSMKVRCLIKLLEISKIERCLIFCNSNETVTSLSNVLKSLDADGELTVRPFSGNMSGKVREKLLAKFANGRINCLVSTDVFTRGIDIADIDLVLNFDMPSHSTTYIHRAGRTGRAGKSGRVVTLCETKQMRHFRREIDIGHKCKKLHLDFSTVMKHAQLEGPLEKP